MVLKEEVFSLWIGDSLSKMEQMCINSFLQKGTVFILYTYGSLKNVPVGTVVKDANSVILEEEYNNYDNPSFFSNLFRYKRLYEIGGIWVDMDLVCIRSLHELIKNSEYIFSSELKNDEDHTNAGIIMCPPKSKVMLDCYNEVKKVVTQNTVIKHGQLGPKVLKKYVTLHELDYCVHPHYVFCPYGYKEATKIFFQSNITYDSLEEDIMCIHLWNNVLNVQGIDKTIPLEKSLYNEFITHHAPEKTFDYKEIKQKNQEKYTLDILQNNICLVYSEIEAYKAKKETPMNTIVLFKSSFNAFIISCNNFNTHVYSYIDKIILDKNIHEPDIKFNILKTLLKK